MTDAQRRFLQLLARAAFEEMQRARESEPRTLPEPHRQAPDVPAGRDAA